jgi:hypothetical protein
MLDVNGQSIGDGTLELVKFAETASAVNEITVTNSATGTAPEIAATGDDTNIDLKLTPKGTGKLNLDGIKFPNADGSSGQFLKTDGSGVLSFAAAGLAWQSVQTTGFTAVKGNAYPCNTTSAGFTVTLPATPSAGDQVQLVDYAGTFDTNALTINPNGEDIEGGASNLQLKGEREGVILTYIDSTQGWIATSGINEGTDALEPASYSVDFLVIAGGGGGARDAASSGAGSAGGAGGYRNSFSTETSGGGGSSEASLTFTPGVVYTVTVGAFGAGATTDNANGVTGSNSSISGTGISTITSSGGGGGVFGTGPGQTGQSGGSGGGGSAANGAGGAGTANQGFNGGGGGSANGGGGGGGAGALGGTGSGETPGNGGNGLASSITGSSVSRGGGGGGGVYDSRAPASTGGTGGGGAGAVNGTPATAGTVNTGGGGGGGGATPSTQGNGGNGGSGVVILRMPTSSYSGTTTGSPTVTTDGSDKVIVFNASGSITG